MTPKAVGIFQELARQIATSIKDIAISLHHVRDELKNIDQTLAETRQVIEEKR